MGVDQKIVTSETRFLDRLVEFIISYFLRLKIARKLTLGYSFLLALLVTISVYALSNLNRLNSINNSILKTDVPVIDLSKKMIDVIFAQELYAQRFIILGTSDLLKLFWEKDQEFNFLVNQIKALPGQRSFPIDRLVKLHKEYNYIMLEALDRIKDPSSSTAKDFENKIKTKQEQTIAIIKGIAEGALRDQNEKTDMTASIGRVAFKAAAVLCGLGFIFSLSAATLITRNISRAIKKLKFATEMISEGNFDHRPNIRNKDELGDLAQAFVAMAIRLKRLEEMYLDTNPLTRLPGGTAIENVVNKRIAINAPIAFCLMDIDNFKAYNDRYGYAKGNDLIQATAAIIMKTVAEYGTEDDFIGHIGGDDFVLITNPDCFPRICEYIVEDFDKTIPDFYNVEDRQRGHIISKNRQGQEVTFPLVSISIAVVTNERRKFLNHIQYGEVAAEMKQYAKSFAGSVYKVDQRRDDPDKSKIDRKLIGLQN